ALAAMAGGIAILRLIIFRSETHRMIGHVIGETLILWGCLIIILSSIDYKRTRDKVHVRSYKSSKLGFLIVVIPLLIVSVLLVWITLP
ncbi:MAG TPA: hypothetical protein VFF04_00515, partial [Candidatus Babeliales bacterium]|nr:hypothetical protein [Candidatus Babeliales bacterium]